LLKYGVRIQGIDGSNNVCGVDPASLQIVLGQLMDDLIHKAAATDGLLGDRDLDYEKDSLYILPLTLLPLQTPALSHCRMIKNIHLESMVEVFNDEESGSGQVEPARLGRLYEWPVGKKHPDGVLIAKLSLLQSFDVYSLRIQLRSLGIETENNAHLRLSESKRRELDRYMRTFTQPLMDLVYTEADKIGVADVGDLIGLFRGEGGSDNALQNLKNLSLKLKIILSKLPAFLTDYGDVFLSLAYFKDQFDAIAPRNNQFLRKVEEMKRDDTVNGDPAIVGMLGSVEIELREIMAHITSRIDSFDKHTATMWQNLNVNSFHKVKILIESNHSTIGGMLCGLHIKMNGYEELVLDHNPSTRAVADYIAAYIRPGIERIKNIEHSARFAKAR